MDLSKLSNEDLLALRAGDLSKVSNDGLLAMRGKPAAPEESFGDKALRVGRGMAQGVADQAIGLWQLRENLDPAKRIFDPKGVSHANEFVREQNKDYEQSRGASSGTFDPSRLAGGVVGPLSIFTAGGGATAGAVGRIAQGAAGGFFGGVSNPVTDGDYDSTKAGQAVVGTVLGAVLPGAWELAKGGGRLIRNIIEPSLGKAGAERSAGRLANEAAGSRKEDVIAALAAAKARETAGQASVPAGSAEFAALTEIAAKNKPSEFVKRAGEQQSARASAIGIIAGTPEELAKAKVARGAQAQADYGAANAIVAKPDADLIKLFDRPSIEKAFSRATELARESGDTVDLASGKNLHYMKMAMDDLIKNPERFGIGATEAKAIGDTQRKFISWIEGQNPSYATARSNFREASKPINQMVAGAELEKALTSGTGKERVGAFTNAVDNATRIPELQRKSGAQRFGSLDEVLTPEQMATVQGVKGELVRDVEFADLAKAGMPKALNLVGQMDKTGAPNMLDRTMMIVNAIANRAAGRGSKKTMDALSDLSLEPGGLAEAMRKATPFQRSQIIDALMRAQGVSAGQAQ